MMGKYEVKEGEVRGVWGYLLTLSLAVPLQSTALCLCRHC